VVLAQQPGPDGSARASHIDWKIGAQKLERHNGVEAVEILGSVPGVSTGQAMEIMKEYASKLPAGIASEWTSVSFRTGTVVGSGGQALCGLDRGGAAVPCRARESAGVPIAVILAVPLGVLGAVLARSLACLQQRHLLRSACSPPWGWPPRTRS
jgi:multidrug efflux pump subunit AcrB